MTNVSIQPLWLTYFIEILLVLEFQITKFIVAAFSYKAHFRPQISSNVFLISTLDPWYGDIIMYLQTLKVPIHLSRGMLAFP